MGRVGLIMDFRGDLARYKNALHFLDTCRDLNEENLAKAIKMALDADLSTPEMDDQMKSMALEIMFKDEPDPEKAYLEHSAKLAREMIMKLIADMEDRLRSLGADPYGKWWQFWK